MTQGTERRNGIVPSRACLIAVLIVLLIFPPSMFGDPISWTGGGDGSTYGDLNNWNLGVVPNNGDGVGYHVSIQSGGGNSVGVTLDNIEQGLDAVTVNSMSINGGRVASTATLSVGGGTLGDGPNLTIGTPNKTYGNALYVGNRGTLSIGDPATSTAANVTLDLSGGGGSLLPGAANSVGAYIANGGSVNVTGVGLFADGSTLVVQNSSGGTRVITNNGSINVGGDGSSSALQFSNQGIPGNFILTGSGSVTLGGFSGITGTTGTENLVNDYGHTIVAAGFNSIGGGTFVGGTPLGSFTNNGTLAVTNGSDLVVGSPLANYNTVTGTLTNGTYNVEDGSTLVLSSVGLGNSISSLSLVNMQLSGSDAQILGGQNEKQQPSGQGSILGGGSIQPIGGSDSSAIGGLTHLTDSSLDLQGVSTTITPSNWSGTLTLRSDPLGIPTNLTVESDPNSNASTVQIAGNVKNVSSVGAAPQQTDANGNSGSTITVNGTGNSLEITGNLNNSAYSNGIEGLSRQAASSNINVTNGGSFTVDNNLYTHTNNRSASSNINVSGGSTLTVEGDLRQGGSGWGMSRGNDTINLTGASTLNVDSNFTNNSGGGKSTVNVGAGSVLNVTDGWYGQFQHGSGQSVLNIDGGQANVENLRNSTNAFHSDTLYFQPQSQINISNGGRLTISNDFANLTGGTLSGGSYYIGGAAAPLGSASTLNYVGDANTGVNTIDYNTALTLDDNGTGVTGQILNNGVDALSGYLNTVNGSLTLENGAQLNLTSALTVNGQLSLKEPTVSQSGNSYLSATGLTNNGVVRIDQGNTVDVTNSQNGVQQTSDGLGQLGNLNGGTLSGGTWRLNGQLLYGVGSDGTSQAITQISGANLSLGPQGGLFYGTPGSTTDALTTLSSVANGSQLSIAGQTRSFNALNIDSSTVNLTSGANVTFSGPGADSGSPSGPNLSLTNGATLNVGQSTATLDFSNGGNSVNTGASVDGTSTINVSHGGTLALTGGGSLEAPGVMDLEGSLNLYGRSSAGVLSVSDGGSYQINGGGSVTVGTSGHPLGQINVSNGNLAINTTLANYGIDGGSGLATLNGGQYIVGTTGTLQLTSFGSSGIQQLNGAAVSVTGNGLLTGDGTTNALSGMTQINSLSSLTLSDGGLTPIAITPGNSSAGPNTFFLNNNIDAGGSGAPTFNLRDGTNVQLNGSFQSFGGNLNITNGSSLTVGYTVVEGPPPSQGLLGGGHSSPTELYVGSFNPIDGSGSLGAQGNSPINLLVGSGSSLIYNGADITSIDGSSTLTLGNRENAGTGTIQNLSGGQHDALSSSLNTVSGTLNLQNNANLTLTGAQSTFQNQGAVTIMNGSTFDVSALAGNFLDVDSSGNLNGNYTVGSNSVLNYSGPSNITNIDGNLTLDNSNWTSENPTTTGMITNGSGIDALSGSLASVGGNNFNAVLTLQNNANLTLTGTSFQNLGAVNITNNSILDVSAMGSGFADVDGSGNQSGTYLIGSGSALNYSGTNITTINGSVTLDNSNNGTTGMITNGGPGKDALSGSLTTINGQLNIQNNAQVELNNGQVNQWGHTRYTPLTLNEGAALNLDQNGGQGGSTLTVDEKLVSTNANINVGTEGNTSRSQLIAVRGLSNTSNDNNSDTYGNSQISVYHSNLTVGQLNSDGSVAQVSNFFNGSFASTPGLDNGGSSNAELDLDSHSHMLVTGNLKNLAVGGSVFTTDNSDAGPTDTTSTASINLTHRSTLQVNGNVLNIAVQGQTDSNDYTTAQASLNLDGGSKLTVNGTYTNFSGNGGFSGFASLNLSNYSTATVSGLFTNSGESLVDIDDYGASGSTLNANGGFKNYNSGVVLNNSSTLNVQGGFLNLSDDSANSAGGGYSALVLGGEEGPAEQPSAQGPALRTGNEGCCGFGGPTVATITGGLINSASTSNGGFAESDILIGSNGTLNVDNLTNIATLATPGGDDSASALIGIQGGTLNVTGNLLNTSSVPFFQNANLQSPGSFGSVEAGIEGLFGTINVGGTLTNSNGDISLVVESQLNSSNGVLNLATDSNFDGTPRGASVSLSGFSSIELEEDTNAYIKGGLTNSATSTVGGYSLATLTIDDGSRMIVSAPTSSPTQGIVYALTNLASASITDAGPGLASAITTISNGSGLTVNGNVLNMSVTPGVGGGAVINVEGDGYDTYGGSTLHVRGTFNNTSATLNVSGGSTARIAGLFTNDANSTVNLTAIDPPPPIGSGNTQGPALGTGSSSAGGLVLPATVLYSYGGFNNAGAVNLNDDTALVNIGTFLNTGNVMIGNGSILSSSDRAGDGVYSQTAGTTTILVGGTLVANSVSIIGGAVNGYNDGSGPTSATIIGNVTIGSDGSELQGEQTATLNLGDPMSIDVIGNYDQTMLGILDLSLAGVGDNGTFTGSLDDNNAYDQINVTGDVLALDGTLNLNLEDGFLDNAVLGDYFNILNCNDPSNSTCFDSGPFGTVNVEVDGNNDFVSLGGYSFTDSLGNLDTIVEQMNTGDGGTELDLVIVGTSATPEPGTLSMLFSAMLIGGGVTWYRRKRKNVAE